MSHDFLGIGWSFPVAAREGQESAPLSAETAHYEESVRQAIWIILSTARGERVMRPDFGCGIHNLVFALDNSSTAGLVEHEVEQALLFWEPRINLLNVTVTSDRRSEADLQSLARQYARFCELEAKRYFHSLPHKDREARRHELMDQGSKVAGPGTTTLPPTQVDEQILKNIIASELPSFEQWQLERKAQLTGPGLLITIEYSVKATNSRFNVVYPFYLERRPGFNA